MSSAAASHQFDVKSLSDAFIYATDWLGVYVEEVNALNVYPVPDGDTGTNMHLTMQSVRQQLRDIAPNTLEELSHALSHGSLMGARGNSGVILSQVLKGFAESIKGATTLDSESISKALQSATEYAYKAVIKPAEGTILTVVRRAAEGVEKSSHAKPLDVLKHAWEEGKQALDETPEMLPILKQAGVVDSGGLGFLRVLEGVIASFEGKELPPPPEITFRAQQDMDSEEFGFCTEFLLKDANISANEIREMISDKGDSLLVVGSDGFVKGHIHTEEPEQLLAMVAKYGTMVRSKVEDMSEQFQEIVDDTDFNEVQMAKSGLVAVSSGYGLTKSFRGLGARVVGGGQSNNPSVQDIADAVRTVPAESIVILPNNKNIIMAAERVNELIPEKEVHVLPTKTLGQGLAVAVAFDGTKTAQELIDDLQDIADDANTLEVTTASRTASIDGVDVTEGQFIGLIDNKLTLSTGNAKDCLESLIAKLDDDKEIATLYYNTNYTEDEIEGWLEQLSSTYEDLEIEAHPGAPDLYDFVMAVE